MKTERFAVDAALLNELGERLVGRAPIALAELIKNAYDADASTCRIEFRNDEIVVSDSGDGMSQSAFLEHWMRLGTTHKVDERVSPGGRALTGSKGIGRLAAQFLAVEMTLESTSAENPNRSLYAIVDWGKIVRGQDLDTVEVLWEMRREHPNYPHGSKTGTRITLRKLKAEWDETSLEGLGREVWRLRSPFRPTPSSTEVRRPEVFDVEIEAPAIANAKAAFNKVLHTLFDNWKARIRGRLESGRSGGRASIAVDFKARYPEDVNEHRTYHSSIDLPMRTDGGSSEPLIDRVEFEILVFKTSGKQAGNIAVDDLRSYLAEFGNVSVYDAGFRLPYYGSGRDVSGQDWLSVALDQGRRLNQSELLPEHLRTQNKYMQDLPAPGRIFGAVDIDTNHERTVAEQVGAHPGEWLQIQPGRDRLHDNKAYLQLRDLVRFSLDFYANRHRLRALQAIEETDQREPASAQLSRVTRLLKEHEDEIPKKVYRELTRSFASATAASRTAEETLDRRVALLGPLATAGMTVLALSHELAREGRFLQSASVKLREYAKGESSSPLIAIADDFDRAHERLESLRELFLPLTSEVDSSATDRLRVRPVVQRAVGAMRVLMPGALFELAGIGADVRFPVGALAEWNAILQNVLSNSWNAMLDTRLAMVSFRTGADRKGREWLHISDTGEGLDVPIAEAEKLFEPFERHLTIAKEKQSIAIGGQGLGLAIVRMIARRRDVIVQFVEPEEGFSTTIEIAWRGGKK